MFLAVAAVPAQRTEITITLNEQFFDTVIDALFQGGGPPEFSLAASQGTRDGVRFSNAAFGASECRETIRLSRENEGVRTAVRFREGRISAPLAFNGSYNPPLVGCVDFAGWAETNIDLEFDQQGQRLVATARVSDVSLNGTGGLGGSVIARMVQSAIDRKVNPIEVIRLDKISFMLPIQNSGNLRMRAVGVRHELANGAINVHIAYELTKT
jgi:hypothetical protein